MDTLSIKIKISDRTYPMKVGPADETFVRKASKLLAERIGDYQKKFGIHDQQDLLAMVAFDCLVQYLKVQETDRNKLHFLLENIDNWSNCIEKALP